MNHRSACYETRNRLKLHNFEVSNTMRSLERVSVLVDPDEVRELVRNTVEHIQNALSGDGDWVSTLSVQFSVAEHCGEL